MSWSNSMYMTRKMTRLATLFRANTWLWADEMLLTVDRACLPSSAGFCDVVEVA